MWENWIYFTENNVRQLIVQAFDYKSKKGLTQYW